MSCTPSDSKAANPRLGIDRLAPGSVRVERTSRLRTAFTLPPFLMRAVTVPCDPLRMLGSAFSAIWISSGRGVSTVTAAGSSLGPPAEFTTRS